jgi:tetratricopeptide (TPR) repeat protein
MPNSKRKQLSLITLCLLIAFSSVAQKGKSTTEPAASTSPAATNSTPNSKEYELEERIFKEALQYNDGLVARVALFRMIQLKPEAKNLYDTLAYLYFGSGQFNEAMILSEKVYTEDNSKVGMLEVKAISEQNLGMLKEALNDFEMLYEKAKDVRYLYQIAAMQYDLKRVAECSNSINMILASTETDKATVPFFTQDRRRQDVPIKAAAFNMRGVLAGELGEFDLAAKAYEEALKLYPEFVLAKNNIEVIKKRKETKSETKPTPAPKK